MGGSTEPPAPVVAPPVELPPLPPPEPPMPTGALAGSCTGTDYCSEWAGATWTALGADDTARDAYVTHLCAIGESTFGHTLCSRAGVTGACRDASGSVSFYYTTEYLTQTELNCRGQWFDAASAGTL